MPTAGCGWIASGLPGPAVGVFSSGLLMQLYGARSIVGLQLRSAKPTATSLARQAPDAHACQTCSDGVFIGAPVSGNHSEAWLTDHDDMYGARCAPGGDRLDAVPRRGRAEGWEKA
jgi:hypothetical protein